jgi:hypothetical protein
MNIPISIAFRNIRLSIDEKGRTDLNIVIGALTRLSQSTYHHSKINDRQLTLRCPKKVTSICCVMLEDHQNKMQNRKYLQDIFRLLLTGIGVEKSSKICVSVSFVEMPFKQSNVNRFQQVTYPDRKS